MRKIIIYTNIEKDNLNINVNIKINIKRRPIINAEVS